MVGEWSGNGPPNLWMKCISSRTFISVSCSGVDYDALRVRFGMSQELADVEHFFSVPRYQSDARAQGWRRTQRPEGPLPELVMFCPSDRAVCALYDSEGFVAGLQFAFLANDLEMDAISPEQHLVRWRPWTWWWQRTLEYWTVTQYFVNEDTLRSDTRRTTGQTVGPEGVWVAGPDRQLINIPAAEEDIASTAFTLQNCVHFMGTHYFYNMTATLDCSTFVPWFALTRNDAIIGSGFITFAKFPEPPAGERDWFERPTVDVARVILLFMLQIAQNFKSALKTKRFVLQPCCAIATRIALPHTSLAPRQILREFGWDVSMHPPHKPDLAPSDFHLFRFLQDSVDSVRWNRYRDRERGRHRALGGDETEIGSSSTAIIPGGPQCLYDWVETYGLLSIHIYYIDEPWTIICS
ncbi:hypothetical protein EVAR_6142_1 [Eumeta japonica]|uniref:Mariner Mos1 transposase n=1 Tax=Eumeta variegata TaxID=151549 RepID=A0A4C1TFE9_EUMVA|nr:hypothetical protein EVAR_6142_1 [Eumeta japonica]